MFSKTNINKPFILSFFVINCLFMITISSHKLSLPLLTKADATDPVFLYISNSVGEDIDQVGISYHTLRTDSYLILSTDQTFTTFETFYPNQALWSRSVIEDGKEIGFDQERYVCKITLTNLLPSTTYYYLLVSGSDYSSLNSFTTPSLNLDTSIAWITDSQAYGNYYTNVNTLLNSLMVVDPNISLVLNTGDVIDSGGQKAQWDSYFNQIPNASQMIFATIPGNHEYYIGNLDISSGDPDIYNQFFHNPLNGIDGRKNSSYYFKYKNILFVMIDTIQYKSGKPNYIDEQTAWFKEVCDNNPAEFIVVGMHLGLYGAASYITDAKTMRYYWGPTFESCGVDLVLSGHEHLFSATKPLTQGKIDYESGIVYVVGNAAGNKTSSIKLTDKSELALREVITNSKNFSGAIIRQANNQLTIDLYDQHGDKLTDNDGNDIHLVINSRKVIDPNPFNYQQFVDNLVITYNDDLRANILSWDNNLYNKVLEIRCYLRGIDDPWIANKQIINSNIRTLSLGQADSFQNFFYNLEIVDLDNKVHYYQINKINDQNTYQDDLHKILVYENDPSVIDDKPNKPNNPGIPNSPRLSNIVLIMLVCGLGILTLGIGVVVVLLTRNKKDNI